jgi:hypothetical protein
MLINYSEEGDMDNTDDLAQKLVAADRLEDEGRWEEAALQRLQAAQQDITIIGDEFVVDATWQWPGRLAVDSPELGYWVWWVEKKSWCQSPSCDWIDSSDGYKWEDPPSWVRRAVEEAATLAVASVIGRL